MSPQAILGIGVLVAMVGSIAVALILARAAAHGDRQLADEGPVLTHEQRFLIALAMIGDEVNERVFPVAPVFSGSLSPGDVIYVTRTGEPLKVTAVDSTKPLAVPR